MPRAKEIVAFLLILIIVISIGIFVALRQEQKPQIDITNFNNIIPGTTSRNEVIDKLGDPLNSREEEDLLVYTYESKSKISPVVITFKDEVVVLIQRPLANTALDITEINNVLGEPDDDIYNADFGEAYVGRVYNDEGIIIFTHKIQKTLFEAWYFIPNELESSTQETQNPLQQEEYIDHPHIVIPE